MPLCSSHFFFVKFIIVLLIDVLLMFNRLYSVETQKRITYVRGIERYTSVLLVDRSQVVDGVVASSSSDLPTS